jgi:CDP-diacylglycerol--glycerol-3-phosphate 3-phosphatidyltransferase
MSDPALRHIPNLLTMARAVMAVMFFVAIGLYRYPDQGVGWLWAAIALFILAAATDFLDGFLARRWSVVSAFGRVMDPFCDKLLVLGAMVCLAGPGFEIATWSEENRTIGLATGLAPWMVVVMLGRELFVTSVRGMAESRGVAFGAKWSGKAKMIVQSVAIPTVMALIAVAPPGDSEWSAWTIKGLMWFTVLITAWSGLPYLAALPSLMRETRDSP